MSTPSEDPSSDLPQRGGRHPGPLAILAATAAGGVVASRLGKVPLLLAASAAAYALLRQKKPASPQPTAPAAPQPEAAAPDPVEQWLSRQMLREEQAPHLDLSAAELTQEPLEDDYRPEAFLLEDAEEDGCAPPPDGDFFASLTEPVPQLPHEAENAIPEDVPEELHVAPALPATSDLPATPVPPVLITLPDLPAPSALLEAALPPPEEVEAGSPFAWPPPAVPPPAPFVWPPPAAPPPASALPQQQSQKGSPFAWPPPVATAPPPAVSPPPAPAVAGSAWALGVDPMPSLNEAVPTPYVAPAGSLFFSPQEPPPVPFSTRQPPRSDVFSTAPVRQEDIGPPLFFATEVFQGAAFPDEIQVPPAAAAEEPAPEIIPPAPAASEPAAPEIQVELAAPGEASFDSALDATPPNPWQQQQPEPVASKPAAQTPAQAAGTVVEAEIILRPRAPMQNAVVSKSKSPSPEDGSDAHFPGPLQSKHDPKPRPTWRSWWRGD